MAKAKAKAKAKAIDNEKQLPQATKPYFNNESNQYISISSLSILSEPFKSFNFNPDKPLKTGKYLHLHLLYSLVVSYVCTPAFTLCIRIGKEKWFRKLNETNIRLL